MQRTGCAEVFGRRGDYTKRLSCKVNGFSSVRVNTFEFGTLRKGYSIFFSNSKLTTAIAGKAEKGEKKSFCHWSYLHTHTHTHTSHCYCTVSCVYKRISLRPGNTLGVFIFFFYYNRKHNKEIFRKSVRTHSTQHCCILLYGINVFAMLKLCNQSLFF